MFVLYHEETGLTSDSKSIACCSRLRLRSLPSNLSDSDKPGLAGAQVVAMRIKLNRTAGVWPVSDSS